MKRNNIKDFTYLKTNIKLVKFKVKIAKYNLVLSNKKTTVTH